MNTRKLVFVALVCMCVWTMGFVPAVIGMVAWGIYIAIIKWVIEKYN